MYLYSKKGTFHREGNQRCGDAVKFLDTPLYSMAVLADGVSTCKYGDAGAEIVSETALSYLKNQYDRLGFLPCEWPRYMLKRIRTALTEEAKKTGADYREYSATLIAAVFDKEKKQIEYCNIGDGMIISVERNSCPVISKPTTFKGFCPVVTTEGVETITDPQCRTVAETRELLLCSDGLWKLMYRRNCMDPAARDALMNGNMAEFMKWAEQKKPYDDYSFVIINTKEAV